MTGTQAFRVATYPRLVAATPEVNLAPGTRITAGSLVPADHCVVQLTGRMRYPTPRTVSTNRT